MSSGTSADGELTRILRDWSGGDEAALERLTPIVYAELHRLARRNLARRARDTLLQPSALVNEAFVRLLGSQPVDWNGRTHFFAHASVLMRHILSDFARARRAAKRKGSHAHVDLVSFGDVAAVSPPAVDIIDLDTALTELARLDSRQAQVVELRYFGGLENADVAAVLRISEPTVVRDWRIARAWLFQRLGGGSASAGQSE